jgi:hypothetical protein
VTPVTALLERRPVSGGRCPRAIIDASRAEGIDDRAGA